MEAKGNRGRGATWTVLLGLLGMAVTLAACGEAPARPRAVILLIGDGMGTSQLALARDAKLPRGERFAFESLPVTALVSTWAASNAVTDSAAAATTLASGVKTDNKYIGLDAEGRPRPRITEAARDAGWRIGYVTNARITHATPAGFYGTVDHRDKEWILAEQLLKQAPEVAIGGGSQYFLPRAQYGKRLDDRNLLDEARAAGFTVVDSASGLNAEQLRAAPPEKLLAVLAGSHPPYELDNDDLPEPARYPELAALTRTALDLLGRDERPFFLLVEGGRIDHAAHSFDAAGVVAEVAAFDRAVQVVLDYQKAHPDTLVLLTADHATGGLALTDYVSWDKLGEQNRSIDWMLGQVRDETEPAPASVLTAATGYDGFDEERMQRLRNGGDAYQGRRTLGTYLSDYNNVTWMPRVDRLDATPEELLVSTYGHTGEDVPLYAGGPGAERFRGVLDNSEIPLRLVDLLGWTLDASALPEP